MLPRVVSGSRHPWRVIAAIEAGIAIVGLAIPFALPFIQAFYVAGAGPGYAGVLARAAVCAVALLPPTILMGATLPAIARWTRIHADGASAIGRFYMANIVGAATGTVLAGFFLLRVYDTMVATGVAIALNLAAAGLALALARRSAVPPMR